MNREKIRGQLIIDEGYRSKVYEDSLGIPTVGIGHKVLPSDNLKIGDVISSARIDDIFNHDLLHAEIGCRGLVRDFDTLPSDIQDALVNMCFNLGVRGLAGFKKMLEALSNRNFVNAAYEARESKWYTQVQKERSERICQTIEKGVSVC